MFLFIHDINTTCSLHLKPLFLMRFTAFETFIFDAF